MTDSEKRVNPEILSEFIEKVSRIFDRDSVENAAREIPRRLLSVTIAGRILIRSLKNWQNGVRIP